MRSAFKILRNTRLQRTHVVLFTLLPLIGWAGGALAANQSAATRQDTSAAADLPSAEALVDQSLDALGGRDAVAHITSRRAEGYMQTPNGELTVTILSADAGKFLIRQAFPDRSELLFGSDGTTLWRRDQQGSHTLLDPGQTPQIRQLDCHNLIDEMLTAGATRQTVARETIGGHDVFRIRVTGQRSADQVDIFLDAETKLLRGKEINKAAGAGGIVRIRFDFDEWKKIGDVQLFSKVSISQAEQHVGTITFTTLEHNSVDPSTFDLPDEVRKLVGQSAPPKPPPPPPSDS